jgi:hypothetical protein
MPIPIIEPLKEEDIATFIETIKNNSTEHKIKTPIIKKKDDSKYIQFAKYRNLEKQIRILFKQQLLLEQITILNHQQNNYKILNSINDELYRLRIDITRHIYRRDFILNEIRQVRGHEYFAETKCLYFESNNGCRDGILCRFRH